VRRSSTAPGTQRCVHGPARPNKRSLCATVWRVDAVACGESVASRLEILAERKSRSVGEILLKTPVDREKGVPLSPRESPPVPQAFYIGETGFEPATARPPEGIMG
jgi:hypothetical protein